MNFRFPKKQRMLGANDFNRVFSNPDSRISTRYLLLLVSRADQPDSRLGLVVSKKNVGGAIKRNRIKRLCREAFRLHRKAFLASDLVILARPGINELENAVITSLVNSLLDKLCLEQLASTS